MQERQYIKIRMPKQEVPSYSVLLEIYISLIRIVHLSNSIIIKFPLWTDTGAVQISVCCFNCFYFHHFFVHIIWHINNDGNVC